MKDLSEKKLISVKKLFTDNNKSMCDRWNQQHKATKGRQGTVPPAGVSKSMVSLSEPALPWFNTRTPAVIVEYGQRSSTAPWTDDPAWRRRRRRCSVYMFNGGQMSASGPVRMSVDLTSFGSPARQNWICTTVSK